MRVGATGSKIEQSRSTTVTIAIVSYLAQKARGSTTGTDRAYSNRESGEDKCSDGMPKSMGRVCTLQSI